MSDTAPTPETDPAVAPEDTETPADPTRTPVNPVEPQTDGYPSDLSASADAGPHDAASAERMGATSDERDLAELAHRAELPEHRPADHPKLGQVSSIDEAPDRPTDSVAAEAQDPEQGA